MGIVHILTETLIYRVQVRAMAVIVSCTHWWMRLALFPPDLSHNGELKPKFWKENGGIAEAFRVQVTY